MTPPDIAGVRLSAPLKPSLVLQFLTILGALGAVVFFVGADAASARTPAAPASSAEEVLRAIDDRTLSNPTASAPVRAIRLHREVVMVKVLGPEGLIDEFVMRGPAGHAGISGGWQLWSHRVLGLQGTISWFTGTLNLDQQPNADFAIRIGNPAIPYQSSGDNGPWRNRGFGHGGMRNVAGSNRITLNDGAHNLQNLREWPVGASISGSSLEIASDFRLLLPPRDAVEAVAVHYVQIFGRSFGLRRRLTASALVPNVAMQDSPAAMVPLNPSSVTHFLPAGAPAERVLSDGRQKPSGGPNPWSSGRAVVHRAYQTLHPNLVLTLTLDFGQPLRASDGSIRPWSWNDSVRYFFTDNTDYAKYYVMAASSSEDPASRRPRRLVPGVVYETQSSLRTVLTRQPAN